MGAIGCASKTLNSKLQMLLLEQSKTVIESMQNLILSAKEAGGNRKVSFSFESCKLFPTASQHLGDDDDIDDDDLMTAMMMTAIITILVCVI